MNIYLLTLAIGGATFMAFVLYCVYAVFKIAHDEDPGCLNPNNH